MTGPKIRETMTVASTVVASAIHGSRPRAVSQPASVQPAADCCTDMMPLTTMATTTTSEKIVT